MGSFETPPFPQLDLKLLSRDSVSLGLLRRSFLSNQVEKGPLINLHQLGTWDREERNVITKILQGNPKGIVHRCLNI